MGLGKLNFYCRFEIYNYSWIDPRGAEFALGGEAIQSSPGLGVGLALRWVLGQVQQPLQAAVCFCAKCRRRSRPYGVAGRSKQHNASKALHTTSGTSETLVVTLTAEIKTEAQRRGRIGPGSQPSRESEDPLLGPVVNTEHLLYASQHLLCTL